MRQSNRVPETPLSAQSKEPPNPSGLAGRLAGFLRGWMPLGVSILAGLLSALVFAGVGSRLAMRATGIMAGPGMQGVRTEADAVVGLITRDGTMFLVFFGTVAGGLAAGFVHAALRPWLPTRRGPLWCGLFALAVGGSAVIEASNFDFRLFGSPSANVAMYVILFVLGGMSVFWLYGRLIGRVGRRLAVALGTVALLVTGWAAIVTGLTGPAALGQIAFSIRDPRPLVIIAVVAALLVQVWSARRSQVPLTEVGGWMTPKVLLGGRAVAVALAALGLYGLALEISGILF